MKDASFAAWCRNATSQIRFTPDQKAVYAELMAHMEDHRDALIAQGMTEEAAQKAALAAMGSAEAIAPQLAQVHPPFWGYAYKVTRAMAIVLCCLLLITIGRYFINISNHVRSGYTLHPEEGQQWNMLVKTNSEDVVCTDGFRFSIPEAVLWEAQDGQRRLYYDLQIFYPPWQEPYGSSAWFWALDNLGNRYEAMQQPEDPSQPKIHIVQYSEVTSVKTMKCYLCAVPTQALQWIELHYDRDGRNIVLRIDLSGGADA